MLKRSAYLGLLAAPLLLALNVTAHAAPASPSIGAAAKSAAAVTDVRWVCGPYHCAWIPNYRAPVVVYPYMQTWGPPPYPHCYYRRGLFGWTMRCN